MASLILEQDGQRRVALLSGRIVIGRRPNSHITIPDRAVSRIHAWIGPAEGGYFVADTGSRTGTQLNGTRMRGRRALADGDQIRIGPVNLIFHSNGALPPDLETIDLNEPRLDEEEDGIFLDCACGAPIWAPWDCGGKTGRCRDCGRLIALPMREGDASVPDVSSETMAPGMPQIVSRRQAGSVQIAPQVAPQLDEAQKQDPFGTTPVDHASTTKTWGSPVESEHRFSTSAPIDDKTSGAKAFETFCGACQSQVSMLEQVTTCPECGVAFHADCWIENHGCSSYGCTQVGILAPEPLEEAGLRAVPATQLCQLEKQELHGQVHIESRAIQWSYLLLPASLLAALGGAPAFGLPSLLLAIAMIGWSVGRQPANRKVYAYALMISVIAAAAGAALSTYWWLGPSSFRTLRP
jgi:hypothetical protein